MFDGVSIFNFSGIYDEESFYRNDKGSSFCDVKVLDLKDVPGTNCMCDDQAVERLGQLMDKEGITPFGIHFIDSGNYHYMSALLTGMVKEPFSLIVLDHHPDMQPPMFGDILSCGGWVLRVLNENEFVRDVHVIGADEGLIAQLAPEDAQRVKFYSLGSDGSFDIESIKPEFPFYLSIDKDVLSRDELITNWDQGEKCSA